MSSESRIEWEAQARQQEGDGDAGGQLDRHRVGAVVHPGHQRDRHPGQHGKREGAKRPAFGHEVGAARHRLAVQRGEGAHGEPGDQHPTAEVPHQGPGPQPGGVGQARPLGRDHRDRREEALCEQLAAAEQQCHEADGEGKAGERLRAGLLPHVQQGEHAESDLHAGDDAGDDRDRPGPMQPRHAIEDDPVEGLVDGAIPRQVTPLVDLHRAVLSPMPPAQTSRSPRAILRPRASLG